MSIIDKFMSTWDNVTQGIGNNLMNVTGQNWAINKQKELYDYQNDIQMQNWEKQNEYNTPAAQAQRLRDAGLNPMFAGLDGTGNAQGMNNATMPTVDNPMNNIAGMLSTIAQVKNLNADTNKKIAETKTEDELRAERLEQLKVANDETREKIKSIGLSNDSQTIINKYLDAKESAAAMKADEEVKLTKEQTNYIKTQSEELRYKIDNMMPQELKNMIKDGNLLDEKVLSEQKNRQHIDAMINEIDVTMKKIMAETNLTYADLLYYDENHTSSGGILGSGISLGALKRDKKNKEFNKKNSENPIEDASKRNQEKIKSKMRKGQPVFGISNMNPVN